MVAMTCKVRCAPSGRWVLCYPGVLGSADVRRTSVHAAHELAVELCERELVARVGIDSHAAVGLLGAEIVPIRDQWHM